MFGQDFKKSNKADLKNESRGLYFISIYLGHINFHIWPLIFFFFSKFLDHVVCRNVSFFTPSKNSVDGSHNYLGQCWCQIFFYKRIFFIYNICFPRQILFRHIFWWKIDRTESISPPVCFNRNFWFQSTNFVPQCDNALSIYNLLLAIIHLRETSTKNAQFNFSSKNLSSNK